MDVIESIVLGVVEGLTEFLPVSSTGHLIAAQYLMGTEKSAAVSAYEVCIQGGAILAVLWLYFPRVAEMLRGLAGRSESGRRLLLNIMLAFTPAAVVGLLCAEQIKQYLFSAKVVMVAWAVGGLVILLYVRLRGAGQGKGKKLEELPVRGALLVGCLQCVAMCPGVSRSLVTMLGGMAVGLSVAAAVEFSFLLGVVTLGAATCHDAVKYGAEMAIRIGWVPLLTGIFAAWGSSLIAIRWMVGYLNRRSLSIFGWYRLAAALCMLLLILHGLR